MTPGTHVQAHATMLVLRGKTEPLPSCSAWVGSNLWLCQTLGWRMGEGPAWGSDSLGSSFIGNPPREASPSPRGPELG